MTFIRYTLFVVLLCTVGLGAQAAEWQLTEFGTPSVESRSFKFTLSECLANLSSARNQQVWSCQVAGPLGLTNYAPIHQPVADYVSLEAGCQVTAVAMAQGPKMEVRRMEAKKYQSISRDLAVKCLGEAYAENSLDSTALSFTYLTWRPNQAHVTRGTYEVESASSESATSQPALQVPLPGGSGRIQIPFPIQIAPEE